MHVKQDILEEMINGIPDPEERAKYAKILTRQVSAHVHCLSDSCNGKIVGHISPNGGGGVEIMSEETFEELVEDADGKPLAKLPVSGLMSHRPRMDGYLGFSCHCGNSSILSQHEDGIVGVMEPTKEDLTRVALRISASPTVARKNPNGDIEVDGFLIEQAH